MARSPARRGLLTVSALLVLVVLYLVSTFVDVWLASRRDDTSAGPPAGQTLPALVLGAAQYNGEPSPVLRQRLDLAIELFEGNLVNLMVVTGGGKEGDATTEAKASYDYLRARGVPDDRVLLEVDGTSTYESIAAASRFLREDGITEVVLVTDRFHARRSLLVAEEVGLDATVALTDPEASFGRLVHETGAVAVGRIISFRRLETIAG